MRGAWWAALMAGCVVLPVALETSGIAHPISATCEGAEEGLAATIDKSQAKAIEFLKTSQMKDGSWTTPRTSGITALVVYSLIDAGVPVTDPVVAKGLERIASYSQPMPWWRSTDVREGSECRGRRRFWQSSVAVDKNENSRRPKQTPGVDAGKANSRNH